MSTAHRLAVVVAMALLAWVVALMCSAPVQDMGQIVPMTVAPAVTYQEVPADG